MVFDSWRPVIKFQTALGGVSFILSVGWLSYILDTLRKYHDRDRLNFNCDPKPSDFIKQRCYDSYISTVTKPYGLIPQYFVAITLGVLCLCGVSFAICGLVALRNRPGDRNNRNAKRFLRIYFIHVFLRILFLGVMFGLVHSYHTLSLPSVFKCNEQTDNQTTPSPLNQTNITLQCNDLHHKEKSNENITFIWVVALVMVLSIFEVLHLGRNRKNFVQALIVDIGDDKLLPSLPEKPTITNTETEVDKDLTVTWSEAEANSTNRSIKYRLECKKRLMRGSTKVFQQGHIVETRHTITDLEYDTEYEVKLFAVNVQGDSEPDVRTFKTKSETVIMPGENTSAQTGNSSPPELNKKLPKLCDLSVIFKAWKTVELPVDILLLVVEDCEFLSCFAYLKESFKSYHKSTSYVYFGYMDDQRKKMKIALKRCSKGPDAPGGSLSASKAAILLLRPKAIFSVGACSGLNNKKVKLGDVVVSAKLITAAHKTPPSRDIGNLIQHVADGWKAPLQNADEYNINVHCDGVVLSISEGNRDMISQYPEAIAVEMEGGGVYAAAHDLKTEWLVVKGIKDFEGETQSSSKEWKQIACVMAASVVANILNDPVIFQDWPHFNAGSTWNIDKDPNQLRCEIGNIVEKLDTIIARQEETRDRDKLTNDFDWMRTTVGNLRDRLDTLTAQQHDAQDQEKMRNDIDQMRSEVGNIKDKLESLMMARQEETQHQRQS